MSEVVKTVRSDTIGSHGDALDCPISGLPCWARFWIAGGMSYVNCAIMWEDLKDGVQHVHSAVEACYEHGMHGWGDLKRWWYGTR